MGIMLVLIIISVVAVLAFLVWSCACISSGVWVKLSKCPRTADKVIFTFDDGPDPVTTPKILDILKRHNIRACFFVIGSKAEKHPELICRMVDEGHVVGNHTFHHSPLFPLSGVPCIVSELKACDSAISNALGAVCHEALSDRYFRPPFGVTNPDIARTVKKTGHKVVGWDVRSYDTVTVRDSLKDEDVPEAVRKCVKRILRKAKPGSVVLLHDRLRHSPELLEALVEELDKL